MASPNEALEKEGISSSWHDQLSSPRLLMTSGDAYNIPLGPDQVDARSSLDLNNHFKSCRWSPDGTTLLTSSADNVLRTFIIPPDLLESAPGRILEPYHQHVSPGSVYASAIHPSFNLAEPSTAVYLASIPNLPVRLLSPFSSGILATYPLVNPNTEAFVAPHSLLFDTYGSKDSAKFFVGSDSQISIFDLNRPGAPPQTVLKTIASKRNKLVGGGVGMKGLVSALGLSSDGLLAAGTFTRWVGLYDSGGMGSEVGVFQLGKDPGDRDGVGEGAGVTQIQWTSDGRYLIVAERASDGISIWDVRGTGKRLAWLSGRNAKTMQRMDVDVVEDNVIAGDVDGNVRMWRAVGKEEGVVATTSVTKLHKDAIPSAVFHPSAAIFATCSGQRHEHIPSSEEDLAEPSAGESEESHSSKDAQIKDGTTDNTLRIWSLYPELQQDEAG